MSRFNSLIHSPEYLNIKKIYKNKNNDMKEKLIEEVLQDAATKYSQSPATTNAGRILRAIASVIPTSVIIKLFAHKCSK